MNEKGLPGLLKQIRRIAVTYCLSDRNTQPILHNQLADEETQFIAAEVANSLRLHGFDAELLEFSFDRISELMDFDWVFNLAESVSGYPDTDSAMAKVMEEYHILFTGAGSDALMLCENKVKAKSIFQAHQIRTPGFSVIPLGESKALTDLPFPLIVKPLHEDGSIGINARSVVLSQRALNEQVKYIHTEHNQDALVEEFINGRDVSISIIGSDNALSVLPPSECIYLNSTSHPILTYDSKWIVDSHDFQNTQVICPARLEKNLKKDLENTSLNAFRITGCKDYARMDFRVRNGVAYLLEVNPNPSIHPQEAGYSRSWKSLGKTYDQLILKILTSSYENNQIQTK